MTRKKREDPPQRTPAPRDLTAGDLPAFVFAYRAATIAAQIVSDTLTAASADQDHPTVIASLTHDRRPHVVLINRTRIHPGSGVRPTRTADTDADPSVAAMPMVTAGTGTDADNASQWRLLWQRSCGVICPANARERNRRGSLRVGWSSPPAARRAARARPKREASHQAAHRYG